LNTIDVAAPVSPERYKAALRGVPAAVAVITASCNGLRNGLTATAVCSVSADPARLLVCVNASASAEVLIRESGRFGVSYLQPGHRAIATRFSQTKLDAASRFAVGDWRTGAAGVPVLADAIASFVCEVVGLEEVGTHAVFIGHVVDVRQAEGAPLLYCGGAYNGLATGGLP
jgi:flavin reductase